MNKFIFPALILVVSMSGCIWIDDDDNGPHHQNLEETIIYINHTGYSIDNFIDDEYVGSVAPNTELRVYSLYYDGQHEFYSQCIDCTLEWGPTFFTLYDGEQFRIYLETSGMSGESDEVKID